MEFSFVFSMAARRVLGVCSRGIPSAQRMPTDMRVRSAGMVVGFIWRTEQSARLIECRLQRRRGICSVEKVPV